MKIDNNESGFLPVLLIAIGAVLVGGTATGVAANSARPGDMLYPVDQALESVQSTLTFGTEGKANMHARMAQERLGELNSLANGNASAENLDQAARNYGEEIEKAYEEAGKISDSQKQEEKMAELAEDTMLQKDEVLGIMDGSGDEAKLALQNAVQASEQTYEKSMNQLSEQKQYEVQNKIEQQVKNMGEEDMLKIKQSTSSGSPTENGNSEDAGNSDAGNSGSENQNSDAGSQPADTGGSSSGSGQN